MGLEPLLNIKLEPKPSVSTNSTILVKKLLIIGLEPILFKNQILSLTCLPVPPNKQRESEFCAKKNAAI